MKRILSVALVLCLLPCLLVGCGKDSVFRFPEELTGEWRGYVDNNLPPFAGATVLTFTPDGVVTVESPAGITRYTVVGTDSTLTVRTMDGEDAWGVAYKVEGGSLLLYAENEFVKVK